MPLSLFAPEQAAASHSQSDAHHRFEAFRQVNLARLDGNFEVVDFPGRLSNRFMIGYLAFKIHLSRNVVKFDSLVGGRDSSTIAGENVNKHKGLVAMVSE